MAIQTGQGIGAAQVVSGSVGTPDISGFTNAIYQEARNRRKQQAEERERALKDAADLYDKRAKLKEGKTPAFTQMGKNSLSKLDEMLNNNEINSQQYESMLNELANKRDYLEKATLEMSKNTDGYVFDEEQGKWRIGNPIVDFSTKSDIDFSLDEFDISNPAKLATSELNPNFAQDRKVDLRKRYDTYAKQLLEAQDPSYSSLNIGNERIASEIRKQAKVNDVLNTIMSDDEAISQVLFNYQVRQNHTPEEAQALLDDEEALRNEFRRQLGVGDLEFIQDVKSSVTNERQEGGGKGITEQDLSIAKEVKEKVNNFQDTKEIGTINDFLAPYNLGVTVDGWELYFHEANKKSAEKSGKIKIDDAESIYRFLSKNVPDIKLEAINQVEFKDPTPAPIGKNKQDIEFMLKAYENKKIPEAKELAKTFGDDVEYVSSDEIKIGDESFDPSDNNDVEKIFNLLQNRERKTKETTTRQDLNEREAERRGVQKEKIDW